MSIFPTAGSTNGWRTADADRDRDRGPETDGVLVRPISGQIYLIEEDDLATLPEGIRSRFSGLVSRH